MAQRFVADCGAGLQHFVAVLYGLLPYQPCITEIYLQFLKRALPIIWRLTRKRATVGISAAAQQRVCIQLAQYII